MKNAPFLLPRLFVFTIVLLCLTNSLFASNYYVSNNGNDTSSGTLSSPLQTIQTALNIADAGDIIYVREGVYAEKLSWANSGNSGNPITLTNYNAENVIISGVNATNANQGASILINTKSHIRINGLIFKDNIMNFADGINVTGSGTDIHITNCEFDNIGWTANKTTFPSPSDSAHAIICVGNTRASLNNIFIGGNYIHDCITGFSESMTIAGNVENFLIEGNTLNSNTNIGIDAAGHFTWTGAPADVNFARSGIIRENVVSNYAGPEDLDAAGGIYTDGGSYITIENNTVFNYKVGYSVGCEVPENSTTGNIVRNNLAYNCSLSGLFLGSNTTSIVNNTQVYNNTFYKCGFSTFDNGQLALQNNNGSIISNNIFYPTEGRTAMIQFVGTTSTNKEQSYNLYWRDSGNTSNLFFGVTGDTNAVLANPEFTNANLENFHISSSSPAVNAGDPNYISDNTVFDIDGQIRVQDGRVDIGIDEIENTTTPQPSAEVEAPTAEEVVTPSCSEGTNLALNGEIVDFSDEQNSTNTVNNIINNSTKNRWSAQGFPQYATVDLGAEYNVNEISLGTFQNRDYQFIVDGSTASSDSSFFTLVDASNNTDNGTITKTFATQKVRYVRLTITGANTYTGPWSSISKFEINCAGNTSNKNIIEEQDTIFDITAFPNPCVESITISSNDNNQEIGSLQLTDIMGRLIIEETVNANNFTFNNLNSITDGIYLLRILNSKKETMKTIKIIKE